MQAALDPYTPGSGKPPQALIGRDNDIDALDTLIVRAARGLGPARPLLLTGLRGVGKTVLLNAMMDRVTEADWFAVKIEASSGKAGVVRARRAIAAGLVRASMAYKARSALAAVGRMLSTVSSFSVSLGIDSFSLGVERDPVRASTGNLDLDFQDVVADVSRVLGEERVAFAILVDEMQDLDGELLAALITTQHEASQRNWNFYVIGAGLPSLPGRLATAKSYAERMFLVRQIGRLSDAESRRVLVEPAERMGARFEEEALTHLVRISGRYPYFLQEFGSAIWRTSPRSPFTGADARRAEAVGLAQLDAMGLSHREPWCDVPGLFRREGLSDPVSVSWISTASGEPSLLGGAASSRLPTSWPPAPAVPPRGSRFGDVTSGLIAPGGLARIERRRIPAR